jgi:hypothetical protein
MDPDSSRRVFSYGSNPAKNTVLAMKINLYMKPPKREVIFGAGWRDIKKNL